MKTVMSLQPKPRDHDGIVASLNNSMLNEDFARLNFLKQPFELHQELDVALTLFTIRLCGRTEAVEVQSFLPKERIVEGPPFFIIPGAAHGADSHELFARQLAYRGFSVYVMSLPGNGVSTTPEKYAGLFGLSYGNLTRCVLDTFEKLSLEKAIWMPHSISGGKALHIAANAPEKFAGVVFHSSISDKGTSHANWPVMTRYPKIYFDINVREQDLRPLYASAQAARELMFSNERTDQDVAPFIARLKNYPFRAYAQTLLPGFIQPKILAEHSIPTLVLAGAQDDIFPVTHAERIQHQSNGELQVYHDSSHNICMDHEMPQVVEDVARWYMDRVAW
jgi:pimeloyl-ACP methyl ester carboxylesterase